MNEPMNLASQPSGSDAGADLGIRPSRPAADEAHGAARQAYVTPALERMGAWSARTLQMTIVIPL